MGVCPESGCSEKEILMCLEKESIPKIYLEGLNVFFAVYTNISKQRDNHKKKSIKCFIFVFMIFPYKLFNSKTNDTIAYFKVYTDRTHLSIKLSHVLLFSVPEIAHHTFNPRFDLKSKHRLCQRKNCENGMKLRRYYRCCKK